MDEADLRIKHTSLKIIRGQIKTLGQNANAGVDIGIGIGICKNRNKCYKLSIFHKLRINGSGKHDY